LREGRLSLVLIRRGSEPFKDRWALPGGFLEEDEDLGACARRELKEETGAEAGVLRQFANFSAPDRDPRERVISAAHYALVRADEVQLQAASDAAAAAWFGVDALPPLAFDHAEIIAEAVAVLRDRILRDNTALALLPPRFALGQLQEACEAVLGRPVDKRNFRKQILARYALRDTGAWARGRSRPARLFESALAGA
jgi:8-oxo-dGTP diphosphatase